MYGGSSDDLLIGGAGYDTLNGESGIDQFYFGENDSGDSISEQDIIFNFNAAEDNLLLETMYYGNPSVFAKGLAFTGGSGQNALRTQLIAGWYFEGSGFNGNGNQLSGIFLDTSNGYIWYNPTSYLAGDSRHFATIDITTVVGGGTHYN